MYKHVKNISDKLEMSSELLSRVDRSRLGRGVHEIMAIYRNVLKSMTPECQAQLLFG